MQNKQSMSFERENLWKYDSQFDNSLLLNEYSVTVLFQPLVDYQQIKPEKSQEQINFMAAFAGGKSCRNSLRLLSTQPLQSSNRIYDEQTLFFCMHQKNEATNQKRFSFLPFHQTEKIGEKIILSLDQPNKVLVVNNFHVVAVEKKCITLYKIQGEQLMVKDFDAVGIGNRLILVDIYHINYKNKDYLLVFGNEKEDIKPFFKCLVYEITRDKLKFIKKATLFQRETYKPIILFDKYSGKDFQDELFCLVIGGFSDYQQQNFVFGALQIHLHLLLQQWIQYSYRLTKQIQFNKKQTITSGKAIKISSDIVSDQCWLLFCTEYQTITKMYIQFGHQNEEQFLIQGLDLITKKLSIRDDKRGIIEPIYYAQNTIYLKRVFQSQLDIERQIPYKIYWCDKKLQRIKSRPLRQFLTLFLGN